jgi:hypothetical protein
MVCGRDLKQNSLFKLTFVVQLCAKYFVIFVYYFWLLVRLIYIKNIYCHILVHINVYQAVSSTQIFLRTFGRTPLKCDSTEVKTVLCLIN